MNEFLEQFIAESRELIGQASDDLLALEEAPRDRERLDSLFRAFHTLKGGAGIMGFEAMGKALHAVEDILSAVRGGTARFAGPMVGDCLFSIDVLARWLVGLEGEGSEQDEMAAAQAILSRFSAEPAPPGEIRRLPLAVAEPGAADGLTGPARELLAAQVAMLRIGGGEGAPGRIGSAARVGARVLRVLGREALAEQLARLGARAGQDSAPLVSALERILAGANDIAPAAAPTPPAQEIAARAVRIDVERVDALVNLAGELTVAKNALGHAAALARDGGDTRVLSELLQVQHTQLDRLVGQLQRSVLTLRVLPLRHVFQRFPRLVREMVVSLDRPARLVTSGEATEADRTIVENLFEPLLHVLRNALDHGIEPAPERASRGKPPSATLELRGRREGEFVVVEVEDDGRGIDVERVRRTAAERGLLSEDALAAMNETEVIGLIFAPGFSTAGGVTSLSGRGVGMDAVRIAVERLGGRVAVENRPGAGALVRFTLPFSVMVSRVMTVEFGGQLFGLPLESVVETVRLPRARIVPVARARAFVLRDRTLPLLSLAETLRQPAPPSIGPEASIVVASFGGRVAGLEVDRLGERMDVILKPLDGLLSGTPGVAGAAVLGNGRVLLVLDVAELLA